MSEKHQQQQQPAMAPTAGGDKKLKVTWVDQGANQNKRRPQVRFSPPPPGRIAKTPAYVPPHMRTPDVAVKRKKGSPSKGPKQPLLRPLSGPLETPSTGEKLPSPLLPPGPPPVFYDPMKSGVLAKRRVLTLWGHGHAVGLSAADFHDEDEAEDDENISDDSEEVVRGKGYKDTENPFVDAGGLKKPPRRDLIDELLRFKKNDGSTGYPPLERDVGVPQEKDEFRMPIPSVDETPPPRWQRGRQPQNWDHEYPGAQVGDYSTLRGGVRNRWPGMVWTQEEVDELGLNPNHEGTSVLERGSPQELKHLGPAWQVLGKIKKGPWQDRLVLPRLKSSAANPKLPVAEADGPKKVVQQRQFISEYEAGFWRENPDDKDFSLEYHQHTWERGQRLLTREQAADLKVPGFERDRVSESFGQGFFDRMRKKLRTRPETESDRDLVYQAKNAQLKEELLQRAARKEDNNLESVFRHRRRDAERAEKQKRITELDDEEDEPMKDAEEEEEMEPRLVPPGAPRAMMVRSGGEVDSPGGSSGYECDDSPVRNRCIACRALGHACNGNVPCRYCIRSKMQCRMPPNPTSSLPVNLPEGSDVFETPENPRGIGRRLGSSSADTLISSGATINNTPGDIFQAAAGLLPPRPVVQWEADPDDDLDVDTEPSSEHWAAHAPPEVGEGPDLGPCQHCITKGIQGTCRPNHDIGLECSSCAGIRVRGDLGHECRVNNILYRPRRHAVTRNRYRGIKGAIVYRCDGCDAARKKDCDVDPFVRAASTSSNAAGGSEAGSGASNNSPKSVMTFHTLSPPGPPPGPPADIDPDAVQTVMPEVTPPGPGRRMSLFHNGFQQQPKRLVNGVVVIDDRPLEPGAISFVNTPRAEVHGNTIIPDSNTIPEEAPEEARPNEPTTFGDSFMSNSDFEPELEPDFNNTSQSFNASQPEGHVLGSDLSPFTVSRSPAARAADYDDNFLRELAEQGPDPRSSASAPARDTWADVAELAGVAAEDRFTRAYLGVHKGISLGVVPDGRNVPPLQRILLTLEGSDTHAVAAANPYVLPPERSDMPSRNALARYLMSTWASPGTDVLRDIPDNPQLLPLAQDHNRCQDYGTEGNPPPCGALVTRSGPSHCENTQHIANHDPNAIQPTYVCDTCDEITTNNLLIGPAALTGHDFQAMRTYACDSCSSAEYVSPGVIMPYDASLVSGCSCASKLLQRRLCSAHRYTLAGALVINTLIIREWQLVNFPPSFCLFCKKTSHGTESSKTGRLLYGPPTVYFCVNCQTRVADPDRSGTLFYGCKIGPLGTVVQDQRGQAIVGALYANNKKLGNSVSSKEHVPSNRSETPELDMMEID
ncbi:hypothetical protein B0T11DRAFT_331437 [Plectosphaerella cucumerina]|uniref:Uncharacterized protein n=1 Tax=Plectosphaerella cucumerina TaxID=40658 RepID=A0A8K0T7X4_9PEZI|nr:hypothetical protein B0T11DRAFT_331437 [Plectosphaerella cucumerina]